MKVPVDSTLASLQNKWPLEGDWLCNNDIIYEYGTSDPRLVDRVCVHERLVSLLLRSRPQLSETWLSILLLVIFGML